MNQCERTNNDHLPFLPLQLLAETCIFRRPHVLTLPEREARSLGCWNDDTATCGASQQHKDNRLDGSLVFVWMQHASSQVASKGLRLKRD